MYLWPFCADAPLRNYSPSHCGWNRSHSHCVARVTWLLKRDVVRSRAWPCAETNSEQRWSTWAMMMMSVGLLISLALEPTTVSTFWQLDTALHSSPLATDCSIIYSVSQTIFPLASNKRNDNSFFLSMRPETDISRTDISAQVPPIGMQVSTTVDLSSGQSFSLSMAISLGVTKCETKKGEGVGFWGL